VNVFVLALALLMANTVFAQGALPGESLYNWKLASEKLWRATTVDPLGTDLKISDRRINEYMAVSANEQRRTEVLQGYNKLLVRFKDDQKEGDRARILRVLQSQQNSLHRAGLSIPELDRYFSGATDNSSKNAPVSQPAP